MGCSQLNMQTDKIRTQVLSKLFLLAAGCRSIFRIANEFATHGLANGNWLTVGEIVDELCRKTHGERHSLRVLQTILQMGRCRVPAVSAFPYHITLLYLSARLHLDAVLLKMQEKRILAIAVRDEDPIASRHGVLLPAWYVIREGIFDEYNGPIGGSGDGLPVTVELLILGAVTREGKSVFKDGKHSGIAIVVTIGGVVLVDVPPTLINEPLAIERKLKAGFVFVVYIAIPRSRRRGPELQCRHLPLLVDCQDGEYGILRFGELGEAGVNRVSVE